jgi:chromosome segregation ATPase
MDKAARSASFHLTGSGSKGYISLLPRRSLSLSSLGGLAYNPAANMTEHSDPSQLLESFIQHVQRLAEDTSYQYLKGILEDNSILRDRNHILNITNHENVKTMAQIQQQLADEVARAEEQKVNLANLTNENSDLARKLLLLEGESATTKTQLDESNEEISRLQAELVNRDTEIEMTKAQLNMSTDEALQLQGELTSKETEIETMKTELEESTNEISNLLAELGDRHNEIEALKLDIEQERSNSTTARYAEEEARTELQSTREELEAKTIRVNQIDALTFKMKNPPHQITYVSNSPHIFFILLTTKGQSAATARYVHWSIQVGRRALR